MQTQKRAPSGGVYAYVKDRGRAWIQSFDSIKQTALVRFDPGEGMRGKVCKVALADIDFDREWKF